VGRVRRLGPLEASGERFDRTKRVLMPSKLQEQMGNNDEKGSIAGVAPATGSRLRGRGNARPALTITDGGS